MFIFGPSWQVAVSQQLLPCLMKKILFLIVLLAGLGLQPVSAQENNYPAYDTNAPELIEIQDVIAETLPDAESMLAKGGTFKPFASVILANDSLASIQVTSAIRLDYTVDDLKEQLSIDALRGRYKVVVLFYLTKVPDPVTGKEILAVGVFAEHTNDDFAYLFYYPYKIDAQKKVQFGESFGDFAPQVMFKP